MLPQRRPKRGFSFRVYNDGRIGICFVEGPREIVAKLTLAEAEGFVAELSKAITLRKRQLSAPTTQH